jgi:hypothetical protein
MNGFEYLLVLLRDVYRLITGAIGYGLVTWFLAFVFAWSGLVKLRQPVLAAMAIVDFKVVHRVRPIFGYLLGAVETLLALGLASKLLPRLTLFFTFLLLCLFTLLIARSLWKAENFTCFCFGNDEAKLSQWTLARTGLLAFLAGITGSAPIPPDLNQGFQINIFQAVIAISLLGIIVLLGQLSRLIAWGKESFQVERDSLLEVNR